MSAPGSRAEVVRSTHLTHLVKALELTNVEKRNLVVMTVRIFRGPDTGYERLDADRLFSIYEQQLFTQVVALAEKAGKHVDLLVVPSSDVFQAAALAAGQLVSREIYVGRSSVMTPEEQAKRMGQAWEHLPRKSRHVVRYRVVERDGRIHDFYLGAHVPSLTAEDIDLIHHLWLEVTEKAGAEGVHHRDVVRVALSQLAEELAGPRRDELLAKFGLGSPKAAGRAARRTEVMAQYTDSLPLVTSTVLQHGGWADRFGTMIFLWIFGAVTKRPGHLGSLASYLLAVAVLDLLPPLLARSAVSSAAWTSLGPEGGTIYALALDPQAQSTLYAGTDRGVYKSGDGGATWHAANAGLINPYVNIFALDPWTPSTLYAGEC